MGRRWTPCSEAGFRNDGVAGVAGVAWPAMVAAGHRVRDARVRRGDALARVFEEGHRMVVELRRRRASSRIQWSAPRIDGVVDLLVVV
jgi:hypothetical protein